MMVSSNNLGGKPQRTSQICRHTKRPALTLQGDDVQYFGQVLIDIDFKLVRDLLKQRLHRLQVKYYWHIIFVWDALLLYLDFTLQSFMRGWFQRDSQN